MRFGSVAQSDVSEGLQHRSSISITLSLECYKVVFPETYNTEAVVEELIIVQAGFILCFGHRKIFC